MIPTPTIRRSTVLLAFLIACAVAQSVTAQTPRPRQPATRPAVPLAKDLPASVRAELEAGGAKLGQEVESLRRELDRKTDLLGLLPDVQVYQNALRYPLQYNEIIDPAKARKALAEGLDRARQLRAGKPEWVHKDGPRGYVSRIDGSVQPYYLVMPTDYQPGGAKPLRLDLFAHGRDEKLTELNFISAKVGNAPAAGPGKFVVLLYGRYCNASKFAGEVDCFEAIGNLKRRHPIDDDRLVLTGFSMGGASVWHLAVHHPGLWAATSPGAGFAETAAYQNLAKKGELATIPWYEQALWHWYDATDYAGNLAHVPTIAYAGELDKQIQASEVMEKAAAAEGIKLERLIGPKTEHKYEPETRKELDRRLDAYAAKGRDAAPAKVRFTTWTLRYPQLAWVRIEGLEQHWSRATIDAAIKDGGIEATTKNIDAVSFAFDRDCPLPAGRPVSVTIDGQRIQSGEPSNLGWGERFTKRGGKWSVAASAEPGLRKRPGLQGPIDDAFMDTFVIVKPTSKPLNEKVGAWAASECDRAVSEWRSVFRGEAQVRTDAAVSDADIRTANLVLFGDPSSNAVLARIADHLPVKWTPAGVTVGGKTYPPGHHVPVLIYPNPLNPERYVVLNSGFTFREGVKISNARQTPRLPDYAVVDITTPPTDKAPGNVVDAGFFGERWELLPERR